MSNQPTYEGRQKQTEDLIKKQEEMLQELPEEFRGTVSHLAYERGHAYGQHEINLHVAEMVGALKEPIEKFAKRIATKSAACAISITQTYTTGLIK